LDNKEKSYTRVNMDYMIKQKEVENLWTKLTNEMSQVHSLDEENADKRLIVEIKESEEIKLELSTLADEWEKLLKNLAEHEK